jgi:hypothetical protein
VAFPKFNKSFVLLINESRSFAKLLLLRLFKLFVLLVLIPAYFGSFELIEVLLFSKLLILTALLDVCFFLMKPKPFFVGVDYYLKHLILAH